MKTLLSLILLPAYGNLFSLLHARLEGRPQTALAWGGPLSLLTFSLATDRLTRLTAHELAPEPAHPLPRAGETRRRLALGVAAGAALAALPALWFRLPGRTPIRTAELRLTLPAFLFRLFVVTPLLVALAEEAAFRGFLQERLHRAFPLRPRVAVLLSSLSFAAWHATINLQTLRRTNVLRTGATSLPLALAGGLAAVFAGGLVFGSLYQRTRSLTAPVAAHWVVDALMLCALYDWNPAARDVRR